jgi:ribosome maturation factor RimP
VGLAHAFRLWVRRFTEAQYPEQEGHAVAIIDQLHAIVEPLCLDLGLELYDLDLNGGLFKVAVDKTGGVGLVDIAQLTREISRALDEHDPISGRYTLEVTSPGLERPLRTPAHFAQALGKQVKVKVHPNEDATRRLEGVVAAVDDAAVVIRVESGDERRIAFDRIEKARTVFAWGPTPRPSSKPKTKKQSAPSGAAKVVNG